MWIAALSDWRSLERRHDKPIGGRGNQPERNALGQAGSTQSGNHQAEQRPPAATPERQVKHTGEMKRTDSVSRERRERDQPQYIQCADDPLVERQHCHCARDEAGHSPLQRR